MPGKPQIERKLAAIMFTDIAGYTALSAKDSTKSSELLKTQRDTLKPIVEKYGGSWMKEMGDALLLTFDSATSAVECSIAIQVATKDIENLNLRIGIHEGEVIKQDGDVIGDDVNVASRIEPFSAVGGVAITHKIEQAISSNQEFETEYIGKPKLKGVSQKVEVYCITSHGLPETDVSKVSAKLEEESKFNIFALTGGVLTAIGIAFWIAVGVFDVSFGGKAEVPSVGILMMENLGDVEDEFWARGITEDLIVKVAGAGLIRVAPMKEILEVDIKESFEKIAKKLRVKYLLTSSLHKNEIGFDLRCQLIEAESGNSKYANKWSEPIDNAPSIVGNLANNILKSLKVSTKQEITQVPTTNTEAYELYLGAKYRYRRQTTEEDIVVSEGLLEKALIIDAKLIEAKMLLGRIYGNRGKLNKALELYNDCLKQAKQSVDYINIAESYYSIGTVHWREENIDSSRFYYQKALQIFQDNQSWKQVANLKRSLGNLLAMERKLEASVEIMEESLNDLKKLNDTYGRVLTLINLANVFNAIGDSNAMVRANNNLEEAKNIAINNGYNRLLVYIYLNSVDVHLFYNNYDMAYESSSKALSIANQLNNQRMIRASLSHIGDISLSQLNLNKALHNYLQVIELYNSESYDGRLTGKIGWIYYFIGEYVNALDYYFVKLKTLNEDSGNKESPAWILHSIGEVFFQKKQYTKAIEYFDKSAIMQMELDSTLMLQTVSLLFLSKKLLGKEFNIEEIHTLIKKQQNIDDYINFTLYKLLGDKSYLETAYNQIQEKSSATEEELATKFLSYPIPKAIVEEWEKVK